MDLAPLLAPSTRRLLFDIPLEPAQGTRFQPTGFPDLGAARYVNANGEQLLLVESAQSMANRLEATIWDSGTNSLIPAAAGLSHVRVTDGKGAFLTASILEAHRLNSAYIEKAKGDFASKTLPAALGSDKKRPLDRKTFVRGLLAYDINALLHGVFLESIDGRLRLPRALSSFIEASQVTVAASGGVKNDRVRAETDKDSGATAKEGFGNVPFHREEFTGIITAYVNLDVEQIRSYGLDPAATRLLLTLALYKIRALFDGGLRLRTACDLVIANRSGQPYDWKARAPAAFALPDLATIQAALPGAIAACAAEFKGEQGATTVTFEGK